MSNEKHYQSQKELLNCIDTLKRLVEEYVDEEAFPGRSDALKRFGEGNLAGFGLLIARGIDTKLPPDKYKSTLDEVHKRLPGVKPI